jgi:hypothetical protein
MVQDVESDRGTINDITTMRTTLNEVIDSQFTMPYVHCSFNLTLTTMTLRWRFISATFNSSGALQGFTACSELSIHSSSHEKKYAICQEMGTHEGIVPIVKRVCLPLPFFFPFPAGVTSSVVPVVLFVPSTEGAAPPPGVHGLATGAGSPRILRKLWLPVACGFTRGPSEELGRAGNAEELILGCCDFLFPAAVEAPGPGIEYGTRGAGEDDEGALPAADADHAVFDCPLG